MTLTIKLDRNWSSFQLANNTPPLSVTGSVIAPSARMRSVTYTTATLSVKCSAECFRRDVNHSRGHALQVSVSNLRADDQCGVRLSGCIRTLRGIHYKPCAAWQRAYAASQRSLHNAPIFRLLLKVAVKGTHQCDFLNFCRDLGPNY